MEDIFFSNEAPLEMLSVAMEQWSVGIRSDNVRQLGLETESERDGRKKGGALDRLLLFSLPWVSFLPQTERKYLNLFSGPENCVFCSPVVSIPCYSQRRDSTHGISHTERHLPQKKKKPAKFTCTFAHTHTQAPETDAQTWFKYIHRNTA